VIGSNDIFTSFNFFLQSVRVASMNCTDEVRALWRRIDCSGKINGTLLLE
jgi:hypothetical protein